MKHQRIKRTFALVLALLCAVSCAAPALAAGQEDAGAQIQAYVQEHEDTLAGMAVSIFNAESVEYENYFGYADRKAGVPVTEDTVFDWGSITKLTVWISVMQLWEQGKLDLAADICDYSPRVF
jgi:Beta-lactamase class C and other penicillin binding proteins